MNKKIWKVLGAGGLALFMGIGTLCGVLISPVNKTSLNNEEVETSVAFANQLNTPASQSGGFDGLGFVTPQDDDPVLGVTDYGLEIKWGNAVPSTGGYSLGSGNLAGFPYFTSGGYTWVIIGRNANALNDLPYKYHYPTVNAWKTHNPDWATYFFGNYYETTSPAGASVSSNILTKASVIDNYILSLSSIKTNAEIPSGCVLCLANGNVTTGVFNKVVTAAATVAGWSSWGEYDLQVSGAKPHGATHYYKFWNADYSASNLKSSLDGYYTNGSYGISAIKSYIKSVSLSTIAGYAYKDTSEDYNYAKGTKTVTTTSYVFTLAAASGNFRYNTYLTAAQAKLSANWWLRTGTDTTTSLMYDSTGGIVDSPYYCYAFNPNYIDTAGAVATQKCNASAGYRPAFCLQI